MKRVPYDPSLPTLRGGGRLTTPGGKHRVGSSACTGIPTIQDQIDNLIRAAARPHAVEAMVRETAITQTYQLDDGSLLRINKRTMQIKRGGTTMFTVTEGPAIKEHGVELAVERNSTGAKYAILFRDTHMCTLTPESGKPFLARLDKGVWEITEGVGADAAPAKPALVPLLNFAQRIAEPYDTTWKANPPGGTAEIL
jgi:hypothetical protein